jgi:hypothetical protein
MQNQEGSLTSNLCSDFRNLLINVQIMAVMMEEILKNILL